MSEADSLPAPTQDWLKQMAEIEDAHPSFSVGGLAVELGLVKTIPASSQRAFGRLIELARRNKQLTLAALALAAKVEPTELVQIEAAQYSRPQPRTVLRLAAVLELPPEKLLELVGLATPTPAVSDAALKFAASSLSTSQLTADEQRALDEFVKVLAAQ